MKKVQAFVAALIVTTLIGLGMFAVGVNAVANADSTGASANAGASAGSASSQQVANVSVNTPSGTDAATQIAQLKNLIAHYQAREKQYQSQIDQANKQLTQANQQLSDANQQVQSLQGVLVELQNRGIIRVMNDGTIQLLVRVRGGGD